jgi:hypothetical protein
VAVVPLTSKVEVEVTVRVPVKQERVALPREVPVVLTLVEEVTLVDWVELVVSELTVFEADEDSCEVEVSVTEVEEVRVDECVVLARLVEVVEPNTNGKEVVPRRLLNW